MRNKEWFFDDRLIDIYGMMNLDRDAKLELANDFLEENNQRIFPSTEAFRKYVSRAKTRLWESDENVISDDEISDDEQEAGQSKFSSLENLSDLFPDELPEVLEKNGKKFYKFNIPQTDQETGEGYIIPIYIAVTTIDQICYDSSVFGKNITQQGIVNKYWLTGRAWNILKERLNLTKLSDAVSVQTMKDADANGVLAETIEDTVDRHFESKKKKIFEDTHARKKDLLFKKSLLKATSQDEFISDLRKALDASPLLADTKWPKTIDEQDELIIFLSDIHLQRKGCEETMEYLASVRETARECSKKNITIVFVGDLIEALNENGMHAGQIALGCDVERWWVGFDLMMKTAKVFEDMLIDIQDAGKNVRAFGIPGNHGRVTINKHDDTQRMGELAIYELIGRVVRPLGIEMNILRETVNALDLAGIRFIIGHGDGRAFDGQNPSQIILKHGTLDRYNVILSGDKHNFQMKDVENRGVWIKTRALAASKTVGTYEGSQDYRSMPWYITIKASDSGKPQINIIAV